MSSFKFIEGVCYRRLVFLGFPHYRVGDDGSIWSKMGRPTSGRVMGIWREMKPGLSESKHLLVFLRNKGKIKGFYIHRLVLLAFVGSCPEGMEACHFPDRDPSNNRLENLKWATHLENEGHKVIHGTSVGNRGNIKGEDNGSAVLNDEKVIQIRTMYASGKHTQKRLAVMFGVHQTKICSVVRGEIWSHVGGPITTVGKGKKLLLCKDKS